jgi:hypothetical protein
MNIYNKKSPRSRLSMNIYNKKSPRSRLSMNIYNKKSPRSRLFPSSRPEWRSHGAERSRQELSRALYSSIPVPEQPAVEMSALCLQGIQYRAMNRRRLTTGTSLCYLLKRSLHLFQLDNLFIDSSKLVFCKRLHFAAGRHFFLHLQG